MQVAPGQTGPVGSGPATRSAHPAPRFPCAPRERVREESSSPAALTLP